MNRSIASADDWYRTKKIADDITFIYEHYIKEFYRCNIWHVRGRSHDMLVDSGMGAVSLRTHVPQLTGKSCIAVATHSHFDHVGSHHEFEERYIHPAEADILENPSNSTNLADQYVCDDMFKKLPPAPYTTTNYSVRGAAATRLIDNGDVIDLGNRHFEVIHTPGHSPGSISLWEAATQILFSGDIVYDGELIDDSYHSNTADYIDSMKRLLDLPVRIVHAGHFASYGNERHRQLIRSWLDEKDSGG